MSFYNNNTTVTWFSQIAAYFFRTKMDFCEVSSLTDTHTSNKSKQLLIARYNIFNTTGFIFIFFGLLLFLFNIKEKIYKDNDFIKGDAGRETVWEPYKREDRLGVIKLFF